MNQVNLVTKCFITNKSNKILILRRSYEDVIRPGKWDLAGGKVEPKEDPNISVVREINEETGLKTTNPEITYISTETGDAYILTLFYVSKYVNGGIVLSDEHIDYKWISISEFHDLDLPEKFLNAAKQINKA